MIIDNWLSHQGRRRTVQLNGQTLIHLHCTLCERDFVKRPGEEQWMAVHVGVFQFNLLDETTSSRWTSEACPGRSLPEESNDRRRGTTKARKNTMLVRYSRKLSEG